MYYNPILRVNINMHTLPLRHAGARVGPRGSTTWPWVPRRIRAGPA